MPAWAVTLFYSQLIRVSLFGQCFITCAKLIIISSVIIELMYRASLFFSTLQVVVNG